MRSLLALSLASLVCAAGCGGTSSATYTVQFEPLVGGAPFSCTQSYPNIGTTKTTIQPLDFRMYVHAVTLVRANGEKQPLALKPDGKWQDGEIALLDFEDGSGTCNTASPETNFAVVGTAPQHSDYTGVEFTLGLPADRDHLSATTAPPPLNQPAMWWSWLGGFRYLKIDVQSTMNTAYFFHLGAEECTGASMTTIDCKYANLATVALTPFTANQTKVAIDLGTLLADANVDLQPDGVTTFTPGCMSSPGDPQCPPIYAKLGLAFDGMGTPPAQTAFTVK